MQCRIRLLNRDFLDIDKFNSPADLSAKDYHFGGTSTIYRSSQEIGIINIETISVNDLEILDLSTIDMLCTEDLSAQQSGFESLYNSWGNSEFPLYDPHYFYIEPFSETKLLELRSIETDYLDCTDAFFVTDGQTIAYYKNKSSYCLDPVGACGHYEGFSPTSFLSFSIENPDPDTTFYLIAVFAAVILTGVGHYWLIRRNELWTFLGLSKSHLWALVFGLPMFVWANWLFPNDYLLIILGYYYLVSTIRFIILKKNREP